MENQRKGLYDLNIGKVKYTLKFNTLFLYRLEKEENVRVEQLALIEDGTIGIGGLYGILASIIKVSANVYDKSIQLSFEDVMDWFDDKITKKDYTELLAVLTAAVMEKYQEGESSGNVKAQQE